MCARIIAAPLLLVLLACAPHAVVHLPQSSPTPALRPAALSAARRESSDPNPWRFCLVGTRDCMTLSEMSIGTCLLSTGRCRADGHIQPASTETRLLLESPAAGGANPEIVLPVER
jgi:hypothetical protein